ncbi:MAG: fatty acid desaturase [Gammaproteobacteria bacterium]|nr:fatty acid desaturase [Gammaproteobacteria bacterium]MDD9897110.1 fatty acid desaturase [Gammaproteobacteria bacterium]MDD9959135.1 fatty acid desaturase [Gammaproteobacteria bacterium]
MEKAPINWINMVLFTATPLGAITLVPLYGYFYGYDLYEWLVFLFLMGFCGMSITGGYHRLWSHKTYTAHPLLRFIFALGGACSLQNDILHWASDHRRHHQFVDNNERDPYSAGRGFWFSHIGWILRNYDSQVDDFSNVQDLQKDPIVMWQHRHYLKLVLLLNIGLPALLGFLHGDIIACLLLGGLLRLVLSQHFTYLINSLAHMWGRQPYSDACTARDNTLLALITYGEGYHNYHHTFQWDYRNGAKWWQFDPTKWMIRLCSFIGLTRDLKRCTVAQIEKARLEMQYRLATERCELLNIPDNWRRCLEQEYEQFLQTLQLWTEHRQAWYESKGKQIQETLGHWDQLQLRDKYKEVQFTLKTQRRRWQKMLRNLGKAVPNPA